MVLTTSASVNEYYNCPEINSSINNRITKTKAIHNISEEDDKDFLILRTES